MQLYAVLDVLRDTEGESSGWKPMVRATYMRSFVKRASREGDEQGDEVWEKACGWEIRSSSLNERKATSCAKSALSMRE